jgi:hypothetical protein
MKTRKLMKSINTKADAMKKWTKADWHLFYSRLAEYDKQTSVRNRDEALLHEIEGIKLCLMHTTDSGTRERYLTDVLTIERQRTELYRLRRVDDEPDVSRGRKQLKQVRKIAKSGGKASPSKYSDLVVTAAFEVFKKRNPQAGVWDAANALIRGGMPLDKFKGVTGPWNRIGRIAQDQLGITRAEWYSGLT